MGFELSHGLNQELSHELNRHELKRHELNRHELNRHELNRHELNLWRQELSVDLATSSLAGYMCDMMDG